jgi:hypothetical protein
MTSSVTSPVTRQTGAMHRGRALVVEVGAFTLAIREKGRRFSYAVSYEQIYRLGAENAARLAREQKRLRRIERRRAR